MWCASHSAAISQEAGDAAAAGDVGLQHVDRAGLEQAPGVVEGVDVFAGGDVHGGRRAVAHSAQTGQIVGGHRLLEPADIVFRRAFGEAQRLLAAEKAPLASTKSSRSPIALGALATRCGSRRDRCRSSS